MVIYANCPYCSNDLSIMESHALEGPIVVECPACGKVFEYIHGFGSFDLPKGGKGVKVDAFSIDSTGVSGVQVNNPKGPQIVACSIILLIFGSGLISAIALLIPLSLFNSFMPMILISAVGFFFILILVIRKINLH